MLQCNEDRMMEVFKSKLELSVDECRKALIDNRWF